MNAPVIVKPTEVVVQPTAVPVAAVVPVAVPSSAAEFTVPNGQDSGLQLPLRSLRALFRRLRCSQSRRWSLPNPYRWHPWPHPVAPPISPMPVATARPAQAAPVEPAPGIVHFQNAPLEQVLDYYSEMVHRTLLRPATLPTASITLNTKNDLTKDELIEALDSGWV